MIYRPWREVLESLKEDGTYRECIAPGVWLMDDHRWAFWVWATNRLAERATLVHADYHFDAVNDLSEEDIENLRGLPVDEIARDYLLPQQDAELEIIDYKTPIQLDSFIAPAVQLGWIQEIFFLCYRTDTDLGLDEEVLRAGGCRQILLNSAKEFAAIKGAPLLFDLCLDLFNLDQHGRMGDPTHFWSEERIREFLVDSSDLIARADMVTISCSFGYSGSAEQTRGLADLVVPRILALREPRAA